MGPTGQPQIGRYKLYGKIAAGGMATVHFGRLLGGAGFSRTVAIKRLHAHLSEDPEFLATLIDEARMASRIHHPNVVSTLDVVNVDGELLVVMDYVRGESLSRLLKVKRSAAAVQVPLPIASAIALGALQGLHAAHEATNDQGDPLGIVHRDVSPQNILVGVDGAARIIDFGVAKASGRLSTTRDGVIKGKMAYMAPEQLESKQVTRVADVYAMAVVLWEMLAGKRLFSGESDAAVFGQVLTGVREPLSLHAPDVPPGLDALVTKALARDPRDRFASAKDMAEELVRVAPPALAMEVGAWVERLGGAALAQRAAMLAEVESGSGVTPPKAEASGPRLADPSSDPGDGSDEGPSVASRSTNLSLEAPRARPSRNAPARRGWHAPLVALGGVVAALGLAALAWQAGASSGRVSSATSPAAVRPSAEPNEREAVDELVAPDVPSSQPLAMAPVPPPTPEPTASSVATSASRWARPAVRPFKAVIPAPAAPSAPAPAPKPHPDSVTASGF